MDIKPPYLTPPAVPHRNAHVPLVPKQLEALHNELGWEYWPVPAWRQPSSPISQVFLGGWMISDHFTMVGLAGLDGWFWEMNWDIMDTVWFLKLTVLIVQHWALMEWVAWVKCHWVEFGRALQYAVAPCSWPTPSRSTTRHKSYDLTFMP